MWEEVMIVRLAFVILEITSLWKKIDPMQANLRVLDLLVWSTVRNAFDCG